MRFKIILEYDGTNMIGWQENAHGHSVQSHVRDALFAFTGTRADVIGAGRTDAGVHARAMTAHIDIEKEVSPHTVLSALNFYLKKSPVIVLDCERVSDDFHARFSCTKRHYKYVILNRPIAPILESLRVWWVPQNLDLDKMRLAATRMIGHHDFTSFRSSECQAKSPVKTLDEISIDVIDEPFGRRIIISVSARSFLHHMVRNIAGTLVEIGRGKNMDIDSIFAAKNRSSAGPTAPAHGLYFIRADYATDDLSVSE